MTKPKNLIPHRIPQHEELTVEKKLLNEIAKDPKQLPLYFELSQHYLSEDRFDKAEEILAQAFEVSDGDPDVLRKMGRCTTPRFPV